MINSLAYKNISSLIAPLFPKFFESCVKKDEKNQHRIEPSELTFDY